MKKVVYNTPQKEINISEINDSFIIGVEYPHARCVLTPYGNGYVAHDLIDSNLQGHIWLESKKRFLISEQENLKEVFVFEDRKELTKWLNEEDK